MRRLFSTSTLVRAGKILRQLKTSEEVADFLHKSTWSVHDVLPKANTNTVDSRVVRKMLKLSGLSSDISLEEEQRWVDALNTHIGFINHLRSDGNAKVENAKVFRLLASDFSPPEPLTLANLLEQVEQMGKEVDPEKGEDGFDFAAHTRTRVTLTKE